MMRRETRRRPSLARRSTPLPFDSYTKSSWIRRLVRALRPRPGDLRSLGGPLASTPRRDARQDREPVDRACLPGRLHGGLLLAGLLLLTQSANADVPLPRRPVAAGLDPHDLLRRDDPDVPALPLVPVDAGVVAPSPRLFRRGDANGDGRIDLDDVTAILRFLVNAAPPPACLDAADADDDGRIEVEDAVLVLVVTEHDAVLPWPGAFCDADPTPDALDCARPGCGAREQQAIRAAPPEEREARASRTAEGIAVDLPPARELAQDSGEPASGCCSRLTEPLAIELPADRISRRDRCTIRVTPCACDVELTLRQAGVPEAWRLVRTDPCSWTLEPTGSGPSGGCLVLEARVPECPEVAPARREIAIASITAELGDLVLLGRRDERGKRSFTRARTTIRVRPGDLDPGELQVETDGPIRASVRVLSRGDRCGSALWQLEARATDNTRIGDVARVQLRIPASCGGADETSTRLVRVVDAKQGKREDRPDAGGGLQGGGLGTPWSGGKDPEPPPADPAPRIGDERADAYPDPCDPLESGNEHQRAATWCWANADGEARVEIECELEEAPPGPVLEQHARLARLRTVDGEGPRDVHETWLCLWPGEARGLDPTARSGEGRLLRLGFDTIARVFNPRLGRRLVEHLAREGCLAETPANLRADPDEYGALDVYVRLRLATAAGGGEVRVTLRGAELSTHPELPDDALRDPVWSDLPAPGDGTIELTSGMIDDTAVFPFRMLLEDTPHCLDPEREEGARWIPRDLPKAILSSDRRAIHLELFGTQVSRERGDARITFDLCAVPRGDAPDWNGDLVIPGPELRINVVDPRLHETRLSLEGDPMTRAVRFHTPDLVSPLLRLDDPVVLVEDEETAATTATVRGHVVSSLASLGVASRVYIEGELVEVGPDGRFEHSCPVTGYRHVITATAYNELGGFARDTVTVLGEQIFHHDELDGPATLLRLRLGPSDRIDIRRDDHVTLGLREIDGDHVPRSPFDREIPWRIELRASVEEDDALWSQPFAISEVLEPRPELGGDARDVLVVPPDGVGKLAHDLWLEIDGHALCIAEFAGLDHGSPGEISLHREPEERGGLVWRTPEPWRALLPDDLSPDMVAHGVLNDADIPWRTSIFARNIRHDTMRAFVASETRPGVETEVTARLEVEAWGPELDVVHVELPLRRGANATVHEADDLDGNPCILETHIFAWNDAVDHHFVPWYELPRGESVEPVIDGGIAALDPFGATPPRARPRPAPAPRFRSLLAPGESLHFPIRPGTPESMVDLELERLRLRVIGIGKVVDGTDDCDAPVVEELHCIPLDGNTERALTRMKASPIHDDGPDVLRSMLLEPLDDPSSWPDYPLYKFWRWGRGKDRGAAMKIARRNANRENSRLLQELLVAPDAPSRELLIVDARVDKERTRFGLGIPDFSFLVKFFEVLATALGAETLPMVQASIFGVRFLPYLYGGDGREQIVIHRLICDGVDARRAGALRPGVGIASGNYPPRVRFQQTSTVIGPGALESLLRNKRGAILTFHGFSHDSDPQRFNEDGEENLLNGFFTKSQANFLRALERRGQADDWCILHVLMTLDWTPAKALFSFVEDETILFNWDRVLAMHTGRRLVAPLIAAIDRAGRDSPIWEGTVLHGASLGARVAASALGALEGLLAPTDPLPRVRFVLAHPALRRRASVEPPRGRIDTNLQQELSIIARAIPGAMALLFVSPYDHAGPWFKIAQHDDMLGRCGPPADHVQRAEDATRYCTIWAGRDVGDPAAPDIFHTEEMGWTVPGSCFDSHSPFAIKEPGFSFSKFQRHLVRVTEAHIDNVWETIGDHVSSGRVPCDAP